MKASQKSEHVLEHSDLSPHERLHKSVRYRFWRTLWVKAGRLQKWGGQKIIRMNRDLENELVALDRMRDRDRTVPRQ